ncbi:uncharacterized protein [Physcomitrium patens]|uniref:uncharacterized protein isoform X1 n=2 Tax=Physcomitrium patens TaxID=3218 RepID=UPI003CCC9BB2
MRDIVRLGFAVEVRVRGYHRDDRIRGGIFMVKQHRTTTGIMGMLIPLKFYFTFLKKTCCKNYTLYLLRCLEDGIGKLKTADDIKNGLTSETVEALTEESQRQFEQFVSGAHQMTACALTAIEACSVDVPQTAQLLQLLANQGCDRQKKQECLESLHSAFEKHMIKCEEEEKKHIQNLWGSMSTQQQDLQVRLEIGNRLQTLRLKKQKVGEALLWLEIMSGPPP